MTLPPRNYEKRGRDNRLRSDSHKRFVRSHLCIAHAQGDCVGPVEFCHARDIAPGGHGGGGKPDDTFGFSACRRHHAESEKRERAWGAENGIDIEKIVLEFAAASPDRAIKEAAKAYTASKIRTATTKGSTPATNDATLTAGR